MSEYDAIIKNATVGPYYPGSKDVICGQIYGDKKGRFKDGEPVRTSYVVSGPDENGIVKTRNSTYLLEMMKP